MSNYELALTAGEIDIALQKASSPDTSPQATSNLVTSGGVKTYVDTAIAALDTTVGATVDTISVPPQLAIRQDTIKKMSVDDQGAVSNVQTGYVVNDHYYPLPFTHGQITVRWDYTLNKFSPETYAISLNIYDTYGVRITTNSNQITATGNFSGSGVFTRTFTGSFGDITTLGNGSLYIVAEGTYDNIQIIEGLPNTVL
jgi:hypothetical protein